jgi:CrcB protein
LLTYLWIAIGGALGSVARYACSSAAARSFGETFPWGTLLVNVLGSFVIGFFSTLTGPDGRWILPPDARLFVAIGVCGGFTTFSSFSLQTLSLIRGGEFVAAFGNIVGSVALCLLSVWAGYVVAALVNKGA